VCPARAAGLGRPRVVGFPTIVYLCGVGYKSIETRRNVVLPSGIFEVTTRGHRNVTGFIIPTMTSSSSYHRQICCGFHRMMQ